MNNCTCHICTTSVKDLLNECFVAYLLGGITTDEYAEITESIKYHARIQSQKDKIYEISCHKRHATSQINSWL